jgi:hypothetical protein
VGRRYSDGLRVGRPRNLGSIPGKGKRLFSPAQHLNGLWGLPSYLSNGYWSTFPGMKRPGREADHLPQSRAEVKNQQSYTFTSSYVFMAWCLTGDLYLTSRTKSFDKLVAYLMEVSVSRLYKTLLPQYLLLFFPKSRIWSLASSGFQEFQLLHGLPGSLLPLSHYQRACIGARLSSILLTH